MNKQKVYQWLSAGILSAVLFSSSMTAFAAEAWKLPAAGLSMSWTETQDYMKQTMQAFYHPAPGAPKPSAFTAPDGWRYDTFQTAGVTVERLTNPKAASNRVILQLHGGGYIGPLHDRYRQFAVQHAVVTDAAETYMLHYRLAPEHTYPAALEDAAAVYTELLRRGIEPERIVVIGDSAGGNLALALSVYLKEHHLPQPKLLILISPWTTMADDIPSRVYNAEKDAVLGKGTPMYSEVKNPPSYAKGFARTDPRLSPLYADLTGLPPILIQAGSYELLLDDSTELLKKAAADNVNVTLTVYPGMPHDFALVMPELQESVDSFREIRDFVNAHMNT